MVLCLLLLGMENRISKCNSSSSTWVNTLASTWNVLMTNLWPTFYQWWLIHQKIPLHSHIKQINKTIWLPQTKQSKTSYLQSLSVSRSLESCLKRTSQSKTTSRSWVPPLISCRRRSITRMWQGRISLVARISTSGCAAALTSRDWRLRTKFRYVSYRACWWISIRSWWS